MKEIVFILGFMGCDESQNLCEKIDVPTKVFVSQAACLDASAVMFETLSSAGYPVVLARCDQQIPLTVENRRNEPLEAQARTLPLVDVNIAQPERKTWYRVYVTDPAKRMTSYATGAATVISEQSSKLTTILFDSTRAIYDRLNPVHD